MKKTVFIFLFLTAIIHAKTPTLIFTYVYNRPDFIELHVKTFAVFFKDPYEYIVFNDAPSEQMSKNIEQTCAKLNVRCFRVPAHARNRQTPSYRHMDGIKYSLEALGFDHNGMVMMVDADMFLIKPFSVKEYMKDHDFIGGYQYRSRDGKSEQLQESNFINGYRFSDEGKIVYTSPCLVFMDMGNLPNKRTINFDGDRVEGVSCDVGGHTYYYFKNNPSVTHTLYVAVSRDYLITLTKSLDEYGFFDPLSIDFIMNNKREFGFQYHADGNFLHFYAGGSNWPKYSASFMQEKTNLVNQYIDRQIAYYTEN